MGWNGRRVFFARVAAAAGRSSGGATAGRCLAVAVSVLDLTAADGAAAVAADGAAAVAADGAAAVTADGVTSTARLFWLLRNGLLWGDGGSALG